MSLLPGTNELSVLAANDASTSQPARVSVTYEAATASEVVSKPKLYLLAVGIARYTKDEFNLRFADKDAREFAASWKGQEGKVYNKVETRVLTDEQATNRAILEGMEWLVRSATQRDVTVLFLSAHGFRDERQNYYLATHEVDPASLRSTGLRWSEVKNLIQDLPGKFLLFVDTCHSGGITGAKGLADDPLRELVLEDTGAVVFSSSLPREVSLEDPRWGHGAFTKAFLDVTNDSASDLNHDGYLSLSELNDRISERVKTLTSGRQHTAVEWPPTITNFNFYRINAARSRRARSCRIGVTGRRSLHRPISTPRRHAPASSGACDAPGPGPTRRSVYGGHPSRPLGVRDPHRRTSVAAGSGGGTRGDRWARDREPPRIIAPVSLVSLFFLLGHVLGRRFDGHPVGGAGDRGHLARLGERRLRDILQVLLAVLLVQHGVPLVPLGPDLVPAPVNLGRRVVVVDVARLRRVVDAVVVAVRRLGDDRLVVVADVVVAVALAIGPARVVILPQVSRGVDGGQGRQAQGQAERSGSGHAQDRIAYSFGVGTSGLRTKRDRRVLRRRRRRLRTRSDLAGPAIRAGNRAGLSAPRPWCSGRSPRRGAGRRSRTTSVKVVSTAGPLPVASPEGPPFATGASSSGGSDPLGQAAAKAAVIVPMLVEPGNFSATALLAYSVTWNESETLFVRCQPGTIRLFLLPHDPVAVARVLAEGEDAQPVDRQRDGGVVRRVVDQLHRVNLPAPDLQEREAVIILRCGARVGNRCPT